jgi:hypothetical protein
MRESSSGIEPKLRRQSKVPADFPLPMMPRDYTLTLN